jgi:hypothetical protein
MFLVWVISPCKLNHQTMKDVPMFCVYIKIHIPKKVTWCRWDAAEGSVAGISGSLTVLGWMMFIKSLLYVLICHRSCRCFTLPALCISYALPNMEFMVRSGFGVGSGPNCRQPAWLLMYFLWDSWGKVASLLCWHM